MTVKFWQKPIASPDAKLDDAYAAIEDYKIKLQSAQKENELLRKIGIALIESDERGQGLPWRESMMALYDALGYNAVLSGKPPHTER